MLISSCRATEMFQFTRCPPSLPMCSAGGLQTSLWRGCPIWILRAHRLYAAPPERFAGLRVLLRPSVPRHPPRTLCSLFVVSFSASLCSTAKLTKKEIQLFRCRLSGVMTIGEWKTGFHEKRRYCCERSEAWTL